MKKQISFRSLSRRFIIALMFLFSVLPFARSWAQQYTGRYCKFSQNDCTYTYHILVFDNNLWATGSAECDGISGVIDLGTGLYGGCPGNVLRG